MDIGVTYNFIAALAVASSPYYTPNPRKHSENLIKLFTATGSARLKT